MSDPLKVLILSAEMVPFAKTGGLADVTGALPKALARLGVDVRVALPRYSRVDRERFKMTEVISSFPVPMDDVFETVTILRSDAVPGVPVYFIDNDKFFNREGIYGYPDDGERFILYCRAALEMLRQIGWQPDILHCNDWHTGIVPNWIKTIYKNDPFFARMATVFTIHNLQYQGLFGWRILEVAGIEEYGFLHHPQIGELADVVDLMARGIHFADVINTVSERYAQEILTPEYGEKLDPLLRDRKDRLFGILNGIDYDEMNPATDRYIARTYDVDHLDQRVENKLALQREAGLPVDASIPLIGMVSRLADQKGFDLLAACFDAMMECLEIQFVLLGTGDQHYHNVFNEFARRYAGRVAIFLTFNAALAQKIYAGSDMFLMPSRFEPCGLGQMISLRYGSIPIVRHTGGLADTITNFDPRTGEGNGFSFQRYNQIDLYTAIVRAVENYKYAETWRTLQRRGMQADYSWSASARKYIDLYQRACEFHRQEFAAV
ncbi:MAG TPA: glycogen synthase GlgA [Chloroflexota bacterium]|nr:glycogen synthase GlgA [Chloroflexota bacterium]